MLPSSGVRVSDIDPSCGTLTFTAYDAWVASSNANGSKVTFTDAGAYHWHDEFVTNTDGPSSDWNTLQLAGRKGGIVLGTIPDCKWVTFVIKYMLHVSGTSTVPVAPISCLNLDTLEVQMKRTPIPA